MCKSYLDSPRLLYLHWLLVHIVRSLGSHLGAAIVGVQKKGSQGQGTLEASWLAIEYECIF